MENSNNELKTILSDEVYLKFEELLEVLNKKFTIELTDQVKFDYKKVNHFEDNMIKHLKTIDISNGIKSISLSLVQVGYSTENGMNNFNLQADISNNSFQLFGSCTLKSNFECRVNIKKETFKDKVLDLIANQDVDFKDDADFSSKFYVVSDNPNNVKTHLNANLRKSISSIQNYNFEIDINNNTLVIGNEEEFDNLKADYLLAIIAFMFEV